MNNERLNTMRNRIENVGLEDAGVDEGLVAEIIDELIDSRSQVTTLTAERDEAQGKLTAVEVAVRNLSETLVKAEAERDEARSNLEKQIEITYEAKAVVSQMQKELAALKSAPGMEEIDAQHGIVQYFLTNTYLEGDDIDDRASAQMSNDNLRDLARRSISSREEVVGLLRWMVKDSDLGEDLSLLLQYRWLRYSNGDPHEIMDGDSPEWISCFANAARIIEIVEGK